MTREEIKQLSWVGDEFVKKPIHGVVMSFHGLGATFLKGEVSPEEKHWAEAGYLTVFPYYGPWSWMNRQAREFVDELVESVYREYQIPNDAPLVSFGGSMGGCSALIFTRYSRKPVTRCCAIFPVCDLTYHYTERMDLPRTMKMAFWGYKEPFNEVLKEHSPLHQAAQMPRIPYFFLHGDADKAVNKEKHSDRMVAELKKLGHQVVYHEIPDYGHGGLLWPEMEKNKLRFVLGT